ncbi:MAG: phage minor capsid protein [Oscillospiraceae bacterium]
MLSPDFIEHLPDEVMEYFQNAERAIIEDIARRISKMGAVTDTAEWQMVKLRELSTAQQNIIAELTTATNMSQQQLIDLFNDAAVKTLRADDTLHTAAGYSPIPLAQNQYMQDLIWAGLKKTNGTFRNLTLTAAQTASQQFESVLDAGHMKLASGAFSYQEVIKQGIKELAQKGIASISYPSGHTDYLDVAFRRATLTGLNQTALQLQERRMQEVGAEFVETTAHAGARPSHAAWQGQVFQLVGNDKYPNFADATGYGTGAGLGGWNCRHGFYPFYPGISKPSNSPEYLDSLNTATVTIDGKKVSLYDAQQMQRGIERNIRKWKRESAGLDAAGLDSSDANAKIKEWQTKQRDLIHQTGLQRDYFRERAGKQNGPYIPVEKIPLKSIYIGKSVGAKAKNYDIVDPATGKIYHLAEGTHIKNVEIFAGKGTFKPLHKNVPEGLTEQYGGKLENWQHAKGFAIIDVAEYGEEIGAEIHWFQEESVGKVKFKIKEWFLD